MAEVLEEYYSLDIATNETPMSLFTKQEVELKIKKPLIIIEISASLSKSSIFAPLVHIGYEKVFQSVRFFPKGKL